MECKDVCLPFQFQPASTDIQFWGVFASGSKLNVVSFIVSLEDELGISVEAGSEGLNVRRELSLHKAPWSAGVSTKRRRG